MDASRSRRLLVGAGFLMWCLAGSAVVLRLVDRAELGASGAAALVALGAFGLAFFVSTKSSGAAAWRVASLGVQTMAALSLEALVPRGFSGALLAVIAAQAALLIAPRAALAWIAVQSLGLAWIATRERRMTDALLASASFLGFQLFALATAYLARREAEAHAETTRLNAELVATRELFADATRTAERLRISRELHDSLGHSLTAMSLELEVARNTVEGNAREPVARAQGLAKDLMTSLREVVSSMREDRPIDISRALRMLATGIQSPIVHLTIAEDLRVDDAAIAHAVFRCVQEATTNAVRHARARNLWIEVRNASDRVEVVARDDGRGTGEVRRGNGLAGLSERLTALGGDFEIHSEPGHGLTLRAFVPARGAT